MRKCNPIRSHARMHAWALAALGALLVGCSAIVDAEKARFIDAATDATDAQLCTADSRDGEDCIDVACSEGDTCEADTLCDVAAGRCVKACPAQRCEIEGRCHESGALQQGQPCHVCSPGRRTDGWSVRVDEPCDDGDWCTVGETCSTEGECRGRERDCDDALSCTRDQCSSARERCEHSATEGCAIDGSCWPAETIDAAQACRQCLPSAATKAWSARDATCRDGRSCTFDDACTAQGECSGRPQPAGSPCPRGLCDGEGGCGGEAVSAGYGHTCVTTNGNAVCFGSNSHGQLGDGTTLDGIAQPDLGALLPVSQVVAGAQHSCAVAAGRLLCWGDAARAGREGTGSILAPEPVGEGEDWAGLSAGATHACGLRNGVLSCWGDNAQGQLGDGSRQAHATPTPVESTLRWDSVSAGAQHTCALSAGALHCWGDNSWGQLGDGGQTVRLAPHPVSDAGWDAVAAGETHTCGLRAGRLWCWGSNAQGQFGSASPLQSATPVLVGLEDDWRALSCGTAHCCGLRGQGDLYCWGNNDDGQLGDGTQLSSSVPLAVGPSFRGVSAGDRHTCALRTGEVLCWGANDARQLGREGDGTTTPTPVAF